MPARVVSISGRVFFDTSVLIYIVSDDNRRFEIASRLLQDGGAVSTHVLNEFVAVVRRKMRQDWDAIKQDLLNIRRFCEPVMPVTIQTHEAGLRIARKIRLPHLRFADDRVRHRGWLYHYLFRRHAGWPNRRLTNHSKSLRDGLIGLHGGALYLKAVARSYH